MSEELFVTANQTVTISNRGLSGTAQLTAIASKVAADIINQMNAEIDTYRDDIKKSQSDGNAMDALIKKVQPIEDIEEDFSFLEELDDDTIDGMLKSQQSKRSRCKSKVMTLDNYKSLMVGAIAENIIRFVTGKEKSAGGPRRTAGSIEFTIEQLQMLEADQEKLRKEIRNIQSKKSIMKSKADFSEDDERWLMLCKVEQQLKDMRIGSSVEIVEVDKTKDALNDLLAGKDLHNMKAADSKELLAQVASLISQSATEEA